MPENQQQRRWLRIVEAKNRKSPQATTGDSATENALLYPVEKHLMPFTKSGDRQIHSRKQAESRREEIDLAPRKTSPSALNSQDAKKMFPHFLAKQRLFKNPLHDRSKLRLIRPSDRHPKDQRKIKRTNSKC